MKGTLTFALSAIALLACSTSTEPVQSGQFGCHLLAASKLSNDAPARTASGRMDRRR